MCCGQLGILIRKLIYLDLLGYLYSIDNSLVKSELQQKKTVTYRGKGKREVVEGMAKEVLVQKYLLEE